MGRGAGGGRRGVPRPVAVLPIALLALALGLAGCGQPEPTPPDGGPARVAVQGRLEGRLVFTRGGNIWVWSDGRETQPIQGDGKSQPRWSPDGGAILFVANGDSYGDLWLVDGEGAAPRALTTNRTTTFPPDSKAYVDGSFLLSGPSWVRLADGGDRIVYSTDDQSDALALWILNGLGGKPQPVFGTRDLGGHIEGAALSPDGTQVAFTYDTTDLDSSARTTQIHVVDLTTGRHRPLTDDPAGSYDPAWSPDGQWIAYTSRQGGGTSIWAMRADGTNRQRLTDGAPARGPAWSPDGDRLAFLRLQGAGYGLFVVELTAPGGGLVAGKPQQIGPNTDLDPASGVSWTR